MQTHCNNWVKSPTQICSAKDHKEKKSFPISYKLPIEIKNDTKTSIKKTRYNVTIQAKPTQVESESPILSKSLYEFQKKRFNRNPRFLIWRRPKLTVDAPIGNFKINL